MINPPEKAYEIIITYLGDFHNNYRRTFQPSYFTAFLFETNIIHSLLKLNHLLFAICQQNCSFIKIIFLEKKLRILIVTFCLHSVNIASQPTKISLLESELSN